MTTPRRLTSTQLLELVETHNLALSLKRLEEGTPQDLERWKRALYHALCLQKCGSFVERQKIREVLELP